MNIFKWLSIPTGETKEVKAYESWTVRWRSRHGEYNFEAKDECEVFTNEKDADDFAKSLRDAFKLIRHTSGNSVSVKKN